MARFLTLTAAVVLCLAVGTHAQLKFLSTGDWGGQDTWPYYTEVQMQVATQMGKTATSENTQFNLGLGDNFYSWGINCDHDPEPNCVNTAKNHRFKDTFEDVYTADSLQNDWYILAGNHDHRGNVSAEIAYTQLSKRWIYPSLWYTFTKTIPGTQDTVQFVMIDTVLLAGMFNPGQSEQQPIIPPASDKQFHTLAQSQWSWINSTLATSTADWLIVCGHYPVWSIAEHGPTAILVQMLKPMLEANKVAFYLNGHDHSLQYLNDGSCVDYIDCGSGHDVDDDKSHLGDVPAGSSKFFLAEGGFISVEIADKNSATLKFILSDGSNPYTVTKTNPRTSS